jgi:VanZ family protein
VRRRRGRRPWRAPIRAERAGGGRVAAAWTAAVALLLLAPIPEIFRGFSRGESGGLPLDKVAHVALFGLLARAWLRAARPAGLAAAAGVAAIAVAYGGLLELLQPVVSARGAEWGDLAADALGAGVALAVARRVPRAAL